MSRRVQTSFTIKPTSEVPGAVLSPERERALDAQLREWTECERRSRFNAHRCFIGGVVERTTPDEG